MSLFVVLILVLITALVLTSFSFWLLAIAQQQPPSDWIVVHVLSPILRTIALIIAVSLVFPILFPQSSVAALWQMLSSQDHFSNLLNILFIASLLMSFLPFIGHPLISMPVQGGLAIAVVFDWFFDDPGLSISWFPDAWTLLKIGLAMLVIFLLGQQAARLLAQRVDEMFHLTGSIQLVADVIYLPLLVPVILIYGDWLKQQLPITVVLGYS